MTMMNELKIGAVDGTYIVFAPITSSVPEVDIYSLPFLFKSVDQGDTCREWACGRFPETEN